MSNDENTFRIFLTGGQAAAAMAVLASEAGRERRRENADLDLVKNLEGATAAVLEGTFGPVASQMFTNSIEAILNSKEDEEK